MALHLPVNGVCNIKCVFCSSEGRSGTFALKQLLDEIDRDKTGHVQISGGDPMIKDPAELLEIFTAARRARSSSSRRTGFCSRATTRSASS